MFTLFASPGSFVILTSPLESVKVDSDVANVGLMVMSSLKNSESSVASLEASKEATDLSSSTKISSNVTRIPPSMAAVESKSKLVLYKKASRRPREVV